MSYFEWAGGHIFGEHAGRKIIDTRSQMPFTIPAAAIDIPSYDIVFPDLWSGTMYHQYRETVPPVGDQFGCSTWIGIVAQEWGPSEPAPNTLPDVTLGSVPAGTSYLEIWVNLTRTVNPANIIDLAFASAFPEGQWVKLDGLSCVIEEFQGIARQFEFVLDGTSVKLRRYQSVTDIGNTVPPSIRQTGSGALGNKIFFFPGTNAPQSGGYAVYGQKIDEKASSGAPTHRPSGFEEGSSNNVPCSMSHAGISYASTWTGAIKIIPGRISP